MRYAFWDYYKTVEDDLIQASRYVEICTQNFACYSVEFARIIMAAGSELDMIFKQLCNKINPNSQADNINEYFLELNPKFPNISKVKRYVRGYRIILEPFKDWLVGSPPFWWSNGYNKVKHQRNIYFHNANLENALNAVSGLMIVLFHYYSIEYGELLPFGVRDQPRLIVPYIQNDPDSEGFENLIHMLK